MTFAYGLALVAVILAAFGQLSLKSAALQRISDGSWSNRLTIIAWLGTGYGAMLAAVSLTAYNLHYLEANVLVSLSALSYPLVLGLSRAVFGERLTRQQLVGLFVICAGVVLYNLE